MFAAVVVVVVVVDVVLVVISVVVVVTVPTRKNRSYIEDQTGSLVVSKWINGLVFHDMAMAAAKEEVRTNPCTQKTSF